MNHLRSLPAVALIAVGVLAGCAPKNPMPMDMTSAVQGAKTRSDHQALADHYEQAAKEADAKAAQQQKMLDQYKEHPYLYGKEIYEVEENSTALIAQYQQIAKANRKLAAMHQKMANAAK